MWFWPIMRYASEKFKQTYLQDHTVFNNIHQVFTTNYWGE
uniref:Uncharacterized protein n=1 Tax=Anguilla anguilla TaxID=7936 RepID=A0A0E9VB06_ANGAN